MPAIGTLPVLIASLIDLQQGTLASWALAGAAAGFAACGFVGYRIGKSKSRSIRTLIDDAHALAAGVSGHRSGVRESGDVGELAAALNQMAEMMEQRTAALADSERRYRFLFDSNPFPMWAWDADVGSILAVNEAAMATYGYDREKFLSLSITDLLDPSERERFKSARLPFAESRQAAGSWIHCTADGRRIEMEVITTSSRRLGRPGWLSVGLDVTAKREAERALVRSEEQIRQAQKLDAIGTFADGISHDFNNLLTAMLGYCDLLRSRIDPASAEGEQLARIRALVVEGTDLSRQILAMSRTAEVRPTLLDPNSVVLSLDPLLRRLIGEQNSLHTHLDESAGSVRADLRQIEQAIIGLVSNARDALPDGGRIDIRVARLTVAESIGFGLDQDSDWTSISVTDNGAGMSDEVKSHIFEPFFTTRNEQHRPGLGLFHAANMAHRVGGDVRALSSPGEGTTIHLLLPRFALKAGVREPDAAEPAGENGHGTILLAEDEDAVRSVVTALLERHGYRVLAAESGDAAIALSARHDEQIDLLITDVVMPGMNGCVLASRLKERFPEMPVLFVSGYTEESVLRQGILDTSGSLLPKPFTANELAKRVQSLLTQSTAK